MTLYFLAWKNSRRLFSNHVFDILLSRPKSCHNAFCWQWENLRFASTRSTPLLRAELTVSLCDCLQSSRTLLTRRIISRWFVCIFWFLHESVCEPLPSPHTPCCCLDLDFTACWTPSPLLSISTQHPAGVVLRRYIITVAIVVTNFFLET